MLAACTAHAASIAPDDYARLLETARRDGSAGVVVHLAPVSLERLHSDMANVKVELANRAAALARELGATVEEGGRWDGGLGQIGLHVTEAGLKMLKNSGNAVSFRADGQWHHRGVHMVNDAKRAHLQARLRRDGYVDVAVEWDVEGLAYDVDASGQAVFRLGDAQRSEARAKAEQLLGQLSQSQAPNRVAALAAVNAAPQSTTVVRVNREGLRKLLDNKDVLTLNPVGFQNTKKRLFDTEALTRAARDGSAEVLISVLDPLPAGGTSESTDSERIRANQRTQEAVLRQAGGGTNVRHYPEFGSVVAQLDQKALRALQQSTDARILSVTLNRPIATAGSLTSVPSMNVPQAWNRGFRGAGQNIVVLDNGINRTHPMFNNTSGQSRILVEGCYGTNQAVGTVTYQSMCPSANATGDSPEWTVGAAAAVANCSSDFTGLNDKCFHGTHVAGIAAGTNTGAAQGVAPDASIVPIQIFSFDRARKVPPKLFTTDMLAALQMVVRYTTLSGPNPLVVNMSISGGAYSRPSECVDLVRDLTTAVTTLAARNVPVVGITGNEGNKSAIGYPACLPTVIKVSSVANDGQLLTESAFSNRPILTNFPGEDFFMAPGGQQTSPTPTSSINSAHSGTGYFRRVGTSMAAPHISGVYALVKGAAPTATNFQIANYLRENSPRTVQGIPVVRLPNL